MKKFWLFISSMLSALLIVVGLSACAPKEEAKDYTVTEVNLKNINSVYHTSDTINFAGVKVEVKFKNADSVTLTKGEFDIEKENAKEDTQFILYTNGLSSQIAGELVEGEYELSVYIVSSQTTKEDVTTITVTSDLSTKYDLISYSNPVFVSAYNKNKTDAGKTADDSAYESSFFKHDDYYVGDDNEFIFRPIMTVIKKGTDDEDENYKKLDNFKVVVKVNGETIVEGQQYDLFKYEDFKFYFKDGTEWTDANNTFTIEMSPADFEKNFANQNVTPATLTVKVADGYNVYDAVDLGRLSLVSDEFKTNQAAAKQTTNEYTYERVESGEVFFNPNGGFKRVIYYDLWENFLTSKGKTNLKPVNGMFIHNNITIDPLNDIPAEYLISVAEAKAFTQSNEENDYGYLVGSFRDEGWLYPHYMENDITFNGNMFKLDFSGITWCLSNSDGSTGSQFYYTKNQSDYFMSHAVLFGFLGKVDNTSAQVATFKNVECMGNSANVTLASDEGASEASGSFILFKSDASQADVDNCIAKAFMIAFYSEYNTIKDTANNGLDVSYCKIYDCYNSGLFSYWGENNTLTHSELKRFGGPAMFLINGTKNDGSKEGGAEWIVDSETVIESDVSGDEAWFGITKGASGIATILLNLDTPLHDYGKTFLNSDGKISMNAILMESAYLGSNERILYNYISYGDVSASNYPFSMDGEESNPINQILNLTGYQAPLFLTNGGNLVFYNGEYILEMTQQGPVPFTGEFLGKKIIIVFPTGAIPMSLLPEGVSLGDTVFVVVCDLTDYVPAAE